ncbi:unnamed protein product [Leuciscus chuanchicus]
MNGKLISIRSACEDPPGLGQGVLPGGKVHSGDAYLCLLRHLVDKEMGGNFGRQFLAGKPRMERRAIRHRTRTASECVSVFVPSCGFLQITSASAITACYLGEGALSTVPGVATVTVRVSRGEAVSAFLLTDYFQLLQPSNTGEEMRSIRRCLTAGRLRKGKSEGKGDEEREGSLDAGARILQMRVKIKTTCAEFPGHPSAEENFAPP